MSASMDVEWLTAQLARSGVPWTLEVHPSLPSTNSVALRRARPWHVVATDHQTKGRGRLHRPWQTPAGAALTVSVTVPVVPAGGWLALAAGVAVQQALQEQARVPARLKWPNDVVVPGDGHRKLCGILCEVGAGGDGEPVAVVGIGVNLTQTREQLPTGEATSVLLAGGRVEREALLVGILAALAPLHADLTAGGARADGVRAAYRERCATLGARVRLVRPGGGDVVGDAVAVDDDGCLVVRGPAGERAWAAGDLTHLRPHPAGEAELDMMPP